MPFFLPENTTGETLKNVKSPVFLYSESQWGLRLSVTNSMCKISFHVLQKKENGTGLKQHEGSDDVRILILG